MADVFTATDLLDALLEDSGGSWRMSCRLSTASKACQTAIRQHRRTLRTLRFKEWYKLPNIDLCAVSIICRDCPSLSELQLTWAATLSVEQGDELVSMLVQAYPKIRRLDLQYAPMSASSLELLETLPELESLRFGRLAGMDCRSGLFGRWPKLRSLIINGMEPPGITRTRGRHDALDCPMLESFEYDASGPSSLYYGLTDRDLPILFVRPPPLRRLVLSAPKLQFSTRAFTSFIQGFPDLRALSVSGDGVTAPIDNGALAALSACSKLEQLDLAWCQIDDRGMATLSQLSCPLTHLDVGGLDIGLHGIHHLGNSHLANSLEHVNLSYCRKIGDEAVELLLEKCTKILSLDVTAISADTAYEACKELRRRNPMLTSLGRKALSLAEAEAANDKVVFARLLGLMPPDDWPDDDSDVSSESDHEELEDESELESDDEESDQED
tara:strand:+ start:198 stop:1520 length:1323 start_codon:yes stop_codon:yes gene_type:complete